MARSTLTQMRALGIAFLFGHQIHILIHIFHIHHTSVFGRNLLLELLFKESADNEYHLIESGLHRIVYGIVKYSLTIRAYAFGSFQTIRRSFNSDFDFHKNQCRWYRQGVVL